MNISAGGSGFPAHWFLLMPIRATKFTHAYLFSIDVIFLRKIFSNIACAELSVSTTISIEKEIRF